MFKSPSVLPDSTRAEIAATLNEVLADGLDLHSQIKVAHWNIKGSHFAALHPLFETFALQLSEFNDDIAERAVTLGGKAYGTTRHVAKISKISEYSQETTRDLDHVEMLAARFGQYLVGLRKARYAAEISADTDTVDMLTGMITAFEKNTWFLQATLENR